MKKVSLVCLCLVICFYVKAQSPVYTFHFDKIGLNKAKNNQKGIGKLTIYSNMSAEFYAKVGNKDYKYKVNFVSASTALNSLILYSVIGSKEEQTSNPYLIIVSGGDYCFYYDPKRDFSMSITSSSENRNKSIMDALMNDFEKHKGVFATFRGEKDIELPLKIDGYQSTHTSTLTANGGDKVYQIRTKSGKTIDETGFKEYEAWTDCSWAQVKMKNENAIFLTYEDNMTGSTRTAKVYVKAGDVTTDMTISQSPIVAKINKVWIEHNKWNGLAKGMKIHVSFETYGVRGHQGECIAYFNFANGQKIMDYNGYYRTVDGQACCSVSFNPPYESTTYNDCVLFMPYTELHLSGHADCKCCVEVHIGGERIYAEHVGFTFN